MIMKKKRILIVMGGYLPGYRSGGPVKSIKNIVDCYGDRYEFGIITMDRDVGDSQPYSSIIRDKWNRVGKAQVLYISPNGFSFLLLEKISNSFDIVYLCGCYTVYTRRVLMLKRFKRIKPQVIIALQGSFEDGAFHIHYLKKRIFVSLYSKLGLFDYVNWHGSTEKEIENLKLKISAKENKYYIAKNLVDKIDMDELEKEKKVGSLSIVWIARIVSKKNLKGVIETLYRVKSDITFHIYGTIRDREYFNECIRLAENLPNNIQYEYKGELKSEDVIPTLKTYQVFLFETFSENFGHVIPEALAAGCPCIISDQTPWLDFEQRNVGYVYPLSEIDKFAKAIEKYAYMNRNEFNEIVRECREYYEELANNQIETSGYMEMFDSKGR